MKNQEVMIQAGRPERFYWRDLWRSRELLYILSMRDISVRYKQTALGMSWSLIRPLLTMLVQTFVFSIVAKLPPDPGVPYSLMVLAGITIWTFFSNSFQQISTSITANANLVTKVYFPRLLMPLSAVAVSFVDFLIAFGLFVAIAFYYQYVPDWHLLFLPAFLLLAMLGAFAFGLFFAAVNVRFRDVGQLIPFLIQVGFYVCPIAYSSSLVVGKQLFGYSLEPLYNLNPVVGIIDGFKWSVLRGQTYLNPQSIINSVVIILSMLVLSIIFFRKRENSFVDDI
jgi:lipopolysaccharide transport system permease protein